VEPNTRQHHVRRFFYDTAGSANPIQIQSLKLLVPASQIVFGTDFPFGNVSAHVSGMQACGLTRKIQGRTSNSPNFIQSAFIEIG
jgi:hypothetical protein